MAKKKNVSSEKRVEEKTLTEMTDSEFLKNVEPMSAPFYFDYMDAPVPKDVSVNGYVSDTRLGMLARNARYPVTETQKPVCEPQTTVKTKNYVRKRTVLLLLIAIMCFGMLAVIVLGASDVPFRSSLALFDRGERGIGVADAASAPVEHLTGLELRSDFSAFFEDLDAKESIAPYAVSVAMILYIVCFVVMAIKALVAIFEKRSPVGYFKKRKFGFLCVVAALCALIAAVGGLYASGRNISELSGFMTHVEPNTNAFGAGIGLYLMLVVPVVVLIFSGFAYGRKLRR